MLVENFKGKKMNNTQTALFLGTILLTIFSGCATKKKPALACFKGSTACFSQKVSDKKDTCVDCVATIKFTKKAVETTPSSHLNLLNNHAI